MTIVRPDYRTFERQDARVQTPKGTVPISLAVSPGLEFVFKRPNSSSVKNRTAVGHAGRLAGPPPRHLYDYKSEIHMDAVLERLDKYYALE